MVETVGERYGYGIFELPFDGLTAYGHGGSIDGFRTRTAFIKDTGVAVSILCNGLNYDMSEIGNAVVKAVSGNDFELPLFEDITLDKTKLDRYPGEFTAEGFPLTITITTTEDGKVNLRATGQQAVTLNADSETEFSLKAFGLELIFENLSQGSYQNFTFKQGGNTLLFSKTKKE